VKNSKIDNDLLKPLRIGDIVEGEIIGREKSAIFLNLGAFGTGIIYGKEFLEAKEQLKDKQIGDKILGKIIDLRNEQGYVELSIREAGKEVAWKNLLEIKEKDESLSIEVKGANKGGLLTEVFKIPAFLPVSQLSPAHYPKVETGDTQKILKELQKFINQELEVKIIDIDPKEEKIILSERAKFLEDIKDVIQVDDKVKGEITAVVDFGAFIKFRKDKREIEGLIHISELDWKLIEDPAEVVKIGQTVEAKIIEIKNGKVFLSLKALKKNPWQEIEKKYQKGDEVSGKVVKINPFGAFVQIEPKIQGLIHISQFKNKKEMEEKLEVGKEYKFQILSILPAKHQISLVLTDKS